MFMRAGVTVLELPGESMNERSEELSLSEPSLKPYQWRFRIETRSFGVA